MCTRSHPKAAQIKLTQIKFLSSHLKIKIYSFTRADRLLLGSIRRTDYWGLSSRLVAKPEELTCRDLMIDCIIRHSLKSSTSRHNLAQMDTTVTEAKQLSEKEQLEMNEKESLLQELG